MLCKNFEGEEQMPELPISSIEAHFDSLPDPRRVDSRTPHKLLDIIVITICAVTCGADGWVAIEAFGHAKYKWLSTFLELPEGIPSHDTFGRVFAALDSTKFEGCFINRIFGKLILPCSGLDLRPFIDAISKLPNDAPFPKGKILSDGFEAHLTPFSHQFGVL